MVRTHVRVQQEPDRANQSRREASSISGRSGDLRLRAQHITLPARALPKRSLSWPIFVIRASLEVEVPLGRHIYRPECQEAARRSPLTCTGWPAPARRWPRSRCSTRWTSSARCSSWARCRPRRRQSRGESMAPPWACSSTPSSARARPGCTAGSRRRW